MPSRDSEPRTGNCIIFKTLKERNNCKRVESIIFLGLGLNAWLTIAMIIGLFCTMAFTKLPAEFAFLGAMAFLSVTGILNAEEVLAGFSSSSVVIVGILFVVIAGLVHSGVIHWLVKQVLGTPSSYTKALVRMMLPVALFSSILSNTTVVALFIKVVKLWSKKLNIAPSKLLIPLSYASCLGGICTLIGTPPNLIISGMLSQDRPDITLGLFDTTIPGLFCLVVGIVVVVTMHKLIPVRKSPDEALGTTSEYTAELVVPTTCEWVGKTVTDAGVHDFAGGRLFEIIRFDKEIISPVPADEYILGGDRLIFSGQIDSILELKDSHGFTAAPQYVFSLDDQDKNRQLYTANVKRSSQLIGKSMDSINFEEHNNAALVAIVRQGERINANPRSVKLERGDTLLLECPKAQGKTFQKAASDDLRFFDSEDIANIGKKTALSAAIMLGMILLSSFNVMTLLQSCFLAAFAMIVTRCCTPEQAWKSISWDVLMIFAGSVCIGSAIADTGIANALANGILQVCGTNPLVALTCICLVGTFVTEFISNTAAAAIFYPIAYQTAATLGVNPVTFCIALMIAVSSSFATPIGSPTHMLVYGEGGYKFTDFCKIGLVMNIVILAANIFIVTLVFPL